MMGKTSQENNRLKKEYEKDLNNLMEENYSKNVEMAERKMIMD